MDSILSAFGTLVGFVIAIIGYSINSQDNAAKNTLRYTTESREKWMNKGRYNASRLIELVSNYHCLYIMSPTNSKEKLINLYSQIQKTIMQLKLYFNCKGEEDGVILDILDAIKKDVDVLNEEIINNYKVRRKYDSKIKQTKKLMILLELHLQAYYKVEWERIKMESGYTGNLETRDAYIKSEMMGMKIECYKNQEDREKVVLKQRKNEEDLKYSISVLLKKLK